MKFIPVKAVFNFILLRLSYQISLLLKRPVILARPFAMSIETVSGCNLHCPQCPTGQGIIKRDKVTMDQDLFEKITSEISVSTFYIQLFFQGEPLLDRQICERISTLAKKRKWVVISTNAQAIDKKNASDLVKSGLYKIIISLDGVKQENYAAYRYGGSAEKTLQAIRYLSESKKLNKSHYPIVEVQTVVSRFNENELNSIKKTALKNGADKMVFKSMQIYNQESMEYYMPKNPHYSRYQYSGGKWELRYKKNRACFRIFSTIVCSSDGKIASCCYDKSIAFELGNINKNSISEIWRNDNFQQFRKRILSGNFPEICDNCIE